MERSLIYRSLRSFPLTLLSLYPRETNILLTLSGCLLHRPARSGPASAVWNRGRCQDGRKTTIVNVFYTGGKGTRTDVDGRFTLRYQQGKLRISFIGYKPETLPIKSPQNNLIVRMEPLENSLSTAVVTGKKGKYSRKNNPAVELMKKVIAAKQQSDLHTHDYYSIDKYSKLTFAFNEVTDKVFEEGKFKRFPFLKEHVEVCNETGKLILPISVDETVTQLIYRKHPKSEKSIILGQRSDGINELFNTGDIVNTMLKDCFTDVNIYEDEVRLLQYPFISPVSTRSAISFYRYFIIDTLMVNNRDKCIRVDFTPNNPQDFGFREVCTSWQTALIVYTRLTWGFRYVRTSTL